MSGGPIRARHARWAEVLLEAYLNRAIARQFHGWRLRIDDAEGLAAHPVPWLFLPNHSSWWDGFVGFLLSRQWQRRFYVMMQLDQLQRYSFFARIGAFSIDRSNPEAIQGDLAYAQALLSKNEALWIFPQGALLPAHAKPLKLATGAARLALAVPQTRIVPVGIRLVFRQEAKPELFVRLGAPMRPTSHHQTPAELTVQITEALTTTLAALDEDLMRQEPEGYTWLRTPVRGWGPV